MSKKAVLNPFTGDLQLLKESEEASYKDAVSKVDFEKGLEGATYDVGGAGGIPNNGQIVNNTGTASLKTDAGTSGLSPVVGKQDLEITANGQISDGFLADPNLERHAKATIPIPLASTYAQNTNLKLEMPMVLDEFLANSGTAGSDIVFRVYDQADNLLASSKFSEDPTSVQERIYSVELDITTQIVTTSLKLIVYLTEWSVT